MGRNVGVAFLLSAKDAASPIIAGAGHAFGGLGETALHLEAGFELAQRALGAFKDVIMDTVGESLKFQNVGIQQEFAEFGHSIDLVKARIGDAFMPTLRALMETFKPIIDSIERWLVANNKLISGEILEWTVKLGKTLVSVVAEGVVLVAQAWYGWGELIDVTKGLIDKFIAGTITGFDKLVQGAAAVANGFGFHDRAVELTKFHQTLTNLIPTWDDAGDASFQAAKKDELALGALQDKIDGVASAANETFDHVLTKGLKNVNDGSVGLNETWSDTGAKGLALAAIAATLAKADLTLHPPKLDSFEQLVDLSSAAKVKLLEAVDALKGWQAVMAASPKDTPVFANAQQQAGILSTQIEGLDGQLKRLNSSEIEMLQNWAKYGDAVGGVLGQMAAGTIKTKDAFKALAKDVIHDLRDMAIKAIESYAVSSAGAAYFSQAGIPVIGPILAVAAASAAFAFVESYMQKFAMGGFVQGFGNRDTVPAWLMPGEYVMNRREVAQGHPDWQKSGAQGGGSTTIVLQSHSLVPDTGPAFMKRAEPLIDLQRQYQRLGLIGAPPATAQGA